MEVTFAVVPGEGIGPEIIDVCRRAVNAASSATAIPVSIIDAPAQPSRDEHGLCLNDDLRAFYTTTFANNIPILHGPAGGRFVYQLRDEFELSYKLTPIVPSPLVIEASAMRPEIVAGTDVLVVRDNIGGLYQGAFGWDGADTAFQEARYDRRAVRALMEVASTQALSRRKHLTIVTKPGGVPTISDLWKSVAGETVDQGVTCEFLEIDNACFQLVTNPRHFDVIVAPNMFGDVIGDTGAVLLGSRGMSFSGNFSFQGASVFQTAHGAAYDLAGRDMANPLAQVLTMCWMLRASAEATPLAEAIERSIDAVLSSGVRTFDIAASDSRVVGTREMGNLLVAQIERSGA